MLKEYLRHTRLFKSVLSRAIHPVKRLFGNSHVALARYRATVRGGTLLLTPKNIPGTFEISATSDLASRIMLSGSYEPEVTASLCKLPFKQGLIVNIGANVGFYAIYLAKLFPGASGILAVEPNPEAFQQLLRNINRNGLSTRIQSARVCISDSENEVELAIVKGMSEYSSIGSIAHPRVEGLECVSIRTPAVPLTTLVGEKRVGLIFVDTEGAEASVFAGARDILIRDKPILFFECSDTLLRKFGNSTEALALQLGALGYAVRNGICWRLPLRHPFEGEGIAIHRDDLSAIGRGG